MQTEETIIEYFELQDGEIFCIQQKDDEFSEETDQIAMRRSIALEMAHDIIRMLSNGT